MAASHPSHHAGAPELVTAEDLWAMHDDGLRELIEGRVVERSPAGRRRGHLTLLLGWRLAEFVETHHLGEVYAAETGFILARNPDTVRAPDISFIRHERLPTSSDPNDDDRFLALAPDLAVEIISPSNSARETSDKVLGCLDAGTALVWVIEPRRRILTAYTADRTARIYRVGDTIDGGDALPGFQLPLADLFGQETRDKTR